MNSKISYDWLPSYIKRTQVVLEIFKMAEYFRDSPHTLCCISWYVMFWILQSQNAFLSCRWPCGTVIVN